MIRFAPLWIVAAVAVGCGRSDRALPTEPAAGGDFLGIPDDQEGKIDDPGSALHGITNVTRVEPADYPTYLSLKNSGKLATEERRGPFIYFAVQQTLCVPMASARKDEATGACVLVTQRYKTQAPQAPETP